MFLVQHRKYTATYAIEPAVEVATLQVRAIADNQEGKLLGTLRM
jgi:hypothetical protein